MEAAAMGIPVIATDIRGCREVVRHGETGLLVPPRNAQALREAIEYLYVHRDVAAAMGKHGTEHIERHFSHARVVERLLEIYADIHDRTKRKRGAA